MPDIFKNRAPSDVAPAANAEAATPDGSDVELSNTSRAIHVGGAGDVVLTMAGGGDVTFTCGAGQLLPVRATHVVSSGTTATGIVAIW